MSVPSIPVPNNQHKPLDVLDEPAVLTRGEGGIVCARGATGKTQGGLMHKFPSSPRARGATDGHDRGIGPGDLFSPRARGYVYARW